MYVSIIYHHFFSEREHGRLYQMKQFMEKTNNLIITGNGPIRMLIPRIIC
jgi:hypothetical protein